jgi:hypothetical protein
MRHNIFAVQLPLLGAAWSFWYQGVVSSCHSGVVLHTHPHVSGSECTALAAPLVRECINLSYPTAMFD